LIGEIAVPEPVLVERPGRDMEALLGLAQVVYGLLAVGLLLSAGLVAIVGVVIDYVKIGDAAGTWLESHFRWQIRTFWGAIAAICAGWVMFVTLILAPLAFVVWGAAGVWVVYRVVKGWLALYDRRALV
jgi:uncharacterized membrane protein